MGHMSLALGEPLMQEALMHSTCFGSKILISFPLLSIVFAALLGLVALAPCSHGEQQHAVQEHAIIMAMRMAFD